ncbi:MAG TPA: isoprenylcysteine carboxylmethyltransferase family protein [Anaerolineaceae bacterium]|nr:isoprenylcysteine carboxylmethyltransferase family protein [Anaerolineaceae bacterium]
MHTQLYSLSRALAASGEGQAAGLAPEADGIPPHLVTEGLYRYMRHPLYTMGLVVVWLTPVMTWNTLALNLGITLYVFFGAYYEERKLHRQFGAAYEAYRKSTPMLVPFPLKIHLS